MNYERQIQSYLLEMTDGWPAEDRAAMEDNFAAQREDLTNGLALSIAKLCGTAAALQAAGQKEAAASLRISFLRTNILAGVCAYRLDLYDEGLFLDKFECCTTWKMDFVWDYFQKRLAALEQIIKAGIYVNKIRAHHLHTVKISLAEQYHESAIGFTGLIIPEALHTPEYAGLRKAPGLTVHMGEYVDKGILLYKETKSTQ
jgi:hypothetical protein